MNEAVMYEILEEVPFDDLPDYLQDTIEELADNEGETIDYLWADIVAQNYVLPRYLEKQLLNFANTYYEQSVDNL